MPIDPVDLRRHDTAWEIESLCKQMHATSKILIRNKFPGSAVPLLFSAELREQATLTLTALQQQLTAAITRYHDLKTDPTT